MEMEIRQEERCRLHGASWEHRTGKRYLHIGETKKDFTSRKAGPPPWLESGESLKTQVKEHVKTRSIIDSQTKSCDRTHLYAEKNSDVETLTQKVLNLCLEIICLLRGEQQLNRDMEPPHYSLTHEGKHKKILEITYKMIELLSGEVPIRCQDVSVYFSMEEWDYIEGHKDQYQDLMMEEHQNLTAPDDRSNKTRLHTGESGSDWESLRTTCRGEDLQVAQGITEDDERMVPVKEVKSCSEGAKDVKKSNYKYRSTDPAKQYSHVYIEEEPFPPEGEIHRETPYRPTDHTYCVPYHIKLEPLSCGPLDTSAGNAQHHPTTYIEEDPVLHGAVDLTDLTFDLPIGFAQLQPPTYVEKPISREGVDLTDPNTDSPLYHARHQQSFDVKEEPVLYNGEDITDPNTDTHIEQTQPQPSAHIKEEPVLYNGEDITDPNTDTHIEQTQPQQSAHIKEEPVLYNGEYITDPNTDAHIEQTQPQRSAHIKEEPVLCHEKNTEPNLKLISWVRGNLPDLNTHTPSHLQSSSTLEEPVTNEAPKMEYTMVLSEEDRKHVLDRTSDCIPKSPVEQCPSTQIIGLTDERPSNPSLVRSVVMAHLLEMAQSKKGLINDINSYSQSQLCPPNTTTISMESDVESLTKKVKVEKSFGDISNLTKYLRVNSKKETPQCLQCGQYFLRKSQLEAHVQVHVKKTSFECMGDQLGEHPEPQAPSNLLKVNEEEKPFQCTECSECFSIYYELYEHKKTHSEDKKYQGPKCGKCYNSQAQCDGHPRTDARKSSYGCNGCGRLFLDREKLLTHQNLHTGRNPYECPDCGKRFEYRSDLIVHRRTHNEHKPAVCYQCGKSFSTHSSLTQHIVTHAKPTQCSFSDLEERSQTDSKECHLVSRVGSEGSAVKTWVVKDGKNTIVENKVTS